MSRRRAAVWARVAATGPEQLARDANTLTAAAAVLRRYCAGVWAEALARSLDKFSGQLSWTAVERIGAGDGSAGAEHTEG